MAFSQINYCQKLNRYNSNQAGKRNREEDNNGEKEGILTYIRRKRANAKVLAYERRRKRESNRDGGGGGISFNEGGDVNNEGKLTRGSSPQTSFLMPHSNPNWYYLNSDMWTEVAKHLGVKEMIILSSTSRWLNSLFSQGYIWKCAFLRDMNIPVACPESFPWKEIYDSAFDGSHAFSLRHQDGHLHIGDVHVLDARHFELFLEEGYKNGTWQYEDIATTIIPYPCDVATSGIFDLKHIRSPNTYHLFSANTWAGPPIANLIKYLVGFHAVVSRANLAQNLGILVKYQVMKNDNGEVVSIRISNYVI